VGRCVQSEESERPDAIFMILSPVNLLVNGANRSSMPLSSAKITAGHLLQEHFI
jgi:hypothetical protein